MKTTHRFVCRNAADLSFLPDRSISLVVTSPPYPMIEMWDEDFARHDEGILDALRRGAPFEAWERMHRQLDGVWHEVARVLIDGGIACINIGDATRTIDGTFQLFPNHTRVAGTFLRLGMQALPAIIWRKQTNAPNKFMGSGMLPPGAYVTLEHEYVLVFRKGGKRAFTSTREKAIRAESAYFWEERNQWFSDVWTDLKGTRQELDHTDLRSRNAAFPFDLPYRLIQMFSVKYDMVLDPFVGTGTTLFAAAASERNSIGVDLEPAFGEVIFNQLDGLAARLNTYPLKRLKDHDRFVAQHRTENGHEAVKYVNEVHGVPVKTRQEVHLTLRTLSGIQRHEDSFEVTYGDPVRLSQKQASRSHTAV